MKKAFNKRPAPFSLRLTFEERARLEKEAAGTSLANYIKWRLFETGTLAPRKRGKVPIKNHKMLAALLAQLGASRMAFNINQLAKAVHTGSLPVIPETEIEIQEATRYIAEMRRMLSTALGLSE